MERRCRFEYNGRHGALVALVLALSLPVAVPAATAVVEEPAGTRRAAADKPITISGKVKPLNRDVEIAVDPESGNGLAVWSRNRKRQSFGQIWAVELIRQGDGSYEAGKPFKVSQSKPAQRPTVEFLPRFGFYMIMWDAGSRDPGKTTGPSRIVSRLYVPTGTASRKVAGELAPEVTMTDGGTNLAPSLVYSGPSSIFERLIYSWRDLPPAARGGAPRLPHGGAHKNHSDVMESRQTLRGSPRSFPSGPGRPYGEVADNEGRGSNADSLSFGKALPCLEGRFCYLTWSVDLAADPLMARFSVSCHDEDLVENTWTPLGEPFEVASLDALFGSLRQSPMCGPLQAITSGGVFEVDPDLDEANEMPFSLDPSTFVMSFFDVPEGATRSGATAIDASGLISHRIARGIFEHRSLAADGDVEDGATRLWKTKRRRLMNMDVETVDDTVLVAWTEKKNRRGSKSIVRLGWFVPE